MKKKDFVLSIVLMGLLLVPILSFAATTTDTPTYVEDTITKITDYVILVSGALVILMYVIAGFLWMSDAGNVERVKIAKSIIVSATIGLVVILLAVGLVSIVKSLVVTNQTSLLIINQTI